MKAVPLGTPPSLTVGAYARALAALPPVYATLPLDELRIALYGPRIIVAHPDNHPMQWSDGAWTVLQPKFAEDKKQ